MSHGEEGATKVAKEVAVAQRTPEPDGGWRDMLAGGISGGITRMLIAPLDVIKIRFQVQTAQNLRGITHLSYYHYTGIVDSIRTIMRQEGFLAFWNGNMLAEILYIAYIGAQFGTYAFIHDAIQNAIPASRRESSQAAVSFVSGGAAALVTVTLTYPLDLLRTRFAAQSTPRTYKTIPQATNMIYRTDGLRGFYSGWAPTALAIVPSMALQFALYDWSKRTWFGGRQHENPLVHAVAGAFSGIIAKLAVLPLDVLKKRLQIHGLYYHRTHRGTTDAPHLHESFVPPNSSQSSSGTVNKQTISNIHTQPTLKDTIKKIYRYEGVAGFFRGAVASTLKAGVSASLTFTFYEQSRRLLLSALQSVD